MSYVMINTEFCSGKESGWVKGKFFPTTGHESAVGQLVTANDLGLI
jgi:hypothetical protein